MQEDKENKPNCRQGEHFYYFKRISSLMNSLGKSLLWYDLHISVTEQDSEKQKEDRSTTISPQSKPVDMPKHT